MMRGLPDLRQSGRGPGPQCTGRSAAPSWPGGSAPPSSGPPAHPHTSPIVIEFQILLIHCRRFFASLPLCSILPECGKNKVLPNNEEQAQVAEYLTEEAEGEAGEEEDGANDVCDDELRHCIPHTEAPDIKDVIWVQASDTIIHNIKDNTKSPSYSRSGEELRHPVEPKLEDVVIDTVEDDSSDEGEEDSLELIDGDENLSKPDKSEGPPSSESGEAFTEIATNTDLTENKTAESNTSGEENTLGVVSYIKDRC